MTRSPLVKYGRMAVCIVGALFGLAVVVYAFIELVLVLWFVLVPFTIYVLLATLGSAIAVFSALFWPPARTLGDAIREDG